MHLRLFAATCIAAALLGCTTARSSDPAPAAASLTERVPAEAGGYRRVEREVLPQGGGLLFRFRDTSSVHLTLFLYPVDSEARHAGLDAAETVRREGAKFAEILAIQERRGVYSNQRLLVSQPDSAAIAAGVHGHTSVATVAMRGRSAVEYQRLFMVDTMFVKLRATVPPARWPRRELDAAIDAIVSALTGTAAPQR